MPPPNPVAPVAATGGGGGVPKPAPQPNPRGQAGPGGGALPPGSPRGPIGPKGGPHLLFHQVDREAMHQIHPLEWEEPQAQEEVEVVAVMVAVVTVEQLYCTTIDNLEEYHAHQIMLKIIYKVLIPQW